MSAIPEIPSEPIHPENWPPHPPKKMLMTPLVVTLGGLLAYFTVVFMVVILPVTTFEPEPSSNWRPLNPPEMAGRTIFLANGCIYCHSGFVRPQDVMAGQYYTYPRAAEPGDFVGQGETPNLFGTVRTGPDLSAAGGFHPDDWHYAHYNNPRYTTPLSVMPQFRFLSREELLNLVAFTQSQGGKLADLRAQHQQTMKALEFASVKVAAPGEKGDRSDGYPSASGIKNLMLIERGYWFEDNPLPVTQQNLMIGRKIFQQRCVSCHGSQGDGKGPGAFYLNPRPAAFNVAADQMHGSDTSPGAYYWRILRGVPGTAMENFGTQFSVEDIWRVVMFIKTIPNGGLTGEVPSPDMYIQWRGYPGLFTWAQCFLPESVAAASANPNTGAPRGIGDVPGIVGEGKVNPVYGVVLWEAEKNARPCGSKGFEQITLQSILTATEQRGGGYARQGSDQIQHIPEKLRDPTRMPPQWIDQVWDKPNQLIKPVAGNP